MGKIVIRMEPGRGDLRCGYCHDQVGAGAWRCKNCDMALHRGCFQEAGSCPTLGCAAGSKKSRRVPQHTLQRLAEPLNWLVLIRIVVLSMLCVVGFFEMLLILGSVVTGAMVVSMESALVAFGTLALLAILNIVVLAIIIGLCKLHHWLGQENQR